jgi:glycosyltransferase involved in cell wall biosynthesis
MDSLPSNCIVVIPCLNEEKTILPLVKAVREHVGDVIVVDDGSSDGTAQLAVQAGAEVIRHKRPRGKGAALNTGWQRAVEHGFDWALVMDGDGQHAAEDIPAFLSAMNGDADLIVGDRFKNLGAMPWLRRKVNEWMSRRLSRAAGFPLPDSQCGFRMMRLAAWSRVTLQAEHFEIESEMLLAFIAGGYGVQFIPVRTIYAAEKSKIKPIRDTLRWFRWWGRAREKMNRETATIGTCLPTPQMPANEKI